MRKTMVHSCLALLLAPVLIFMLIGSITLSVQADGPAAPGSSDTGSGGSGSSGTGSGSGGSDSSGSGSADGPFIQVTIKLNSTAVTSPLVLTFGDDKTLSAEVRRFENSTDTAGRVVTGASIAWGCVNPTTNQADSSVGLIDKASGRLQAVGVGTAKVTVAATVNYRGQTLKDDASCTVTVGDLYQLQITEHNFSVTRLTVNANETRQLRAVVTKNSEIVSGAVTWSSSNEEVAQVDPATGLLTAKKTGTASITAVYAYKIPNPDPDAAEKELLREVRNTVVCTVKAGSGGSGGGDPDDPGTSDGQLPEGVSVKSVTITAPSEDINMNPGTQDVKAIVVFSKGQNDQSKEIEWTRMGTSTATYTDGAKSYTIPVTWESSDSTVAYVSGRKLNASAPGVTSITAIAGGTPSNELKVTVNGYKLLRSTVTILENESFNPAGPGEQEDRRVVTSYGDAKLNELSYWSDASNVAGYINGSIMGTTPGSATFTVSGSKGSFRATFQVIVQADPSATIELEPLYTQSRKTRPFSELLSRFQPQAGGQLSHINGLQVDPSQGVLYYKYKSEDAPGTGVGSGSYYYPYRTGGILAGQPSMADITFVPREGYAGQVAIYYNAVSESNKNYACRILFTVIPGQDTGLDSGIRLSTPYNTPVRLNSDDFNRVCREQTGLSLSNVTFTQPPQRQGTLYTNYVAEGNYGSAVSPSTRYSKRDLDDISFVPAPGYTGTVTVYYTARSTGSPGTTYSGQFTVTVGGENSVTVGGPSYDVASGGVARFNDEDFNSYCRQVLSYSQTLSYIRFEALPETGQGTLYYNYRSSGSTGSPVQAGSSYYYGTRSPRIDWITFVPAQDFHGTVRIPFTGWTSDGARLNGSVEINVREGGGSGDIRYTCAAGRSVSFRSSDFSGLCRDLTNSSLNYIILQGLPGSADGYLYHNNTRINSTGARYYNGTSSNRISALSFRASSSFTGTVDIPFVGYATSGETFSGTVSVDAAGSAQLDNIRYYTSYSAAAVFQRDDFDSLSQWATDRNVSTVRFELPSSGQGDLYRNYYSSSNRGSRITSSTSISAGSLNQVAFVPASGYVGTVYINFTGTATNSESFAGTVEIRVDRPGSDVTVRYNTRTAPVKFRAEDFRRNGSGLSYVQFGSMPSSGEGHLYYQYSGPAGYRQEAGTGTAYRSSGSSLISDLTFVPRAGYSGTVTLPYTGMNSNGTTFEGEVEITVSPSYSSAYFSDMNGYSSQQRAAVDFLRENGIANGISASQYGPEYSITRGDFAVMVYQAFGLTPRNTAGAFLDVPAGVYYAQAVNTLQSMGIVSGVGGGAYAPRDTLSRQDAVCMIQRAMRAIGWSANDGYASALYGFSDGSAVSGYAQGAMANAVQRGYLPTYNGRLAPKDPLKRVDMAEIIHRVLTY